MMIMPEPENKNECETECENACGAECKTECETERGDEINPQKFGRYFGVCASFHHSKVCLCPVCSLRPAVGIIMYCAKGACPTYGSGDDGNKTIGCAGADVEGNDSCLCPGCAVYKQFAMEGSDFCKTD
ncbi:hypothetical protein MsAg5_04350 [Methanosarcinaceae archaeon Ag5]|uniref:DUF2769 domain-containing protein n=1 Tax=Methanolapillus africanus TaxID=3028297 RepID=A0AAE4SDB6_9EURY|nr:hypothetical protein [Methanosarcinaceae archaeon Ag5]